MLVLTLCADLLYAVYVSITLNGKESFFFFLSLEESTELSTEFSQKLVKITPNQVGKEIPFITLMLKEMYGVNSLEVKNLNAK